MTNLASALLEAQRAMPAIHKDSKADTGKFSYTYLSLQGLLALVVPVLNASGLALAQVPTFHASGLQSLTTTLFHAESGETLVSESPLVVSGAQTPQTWGGAVTYARRYALTSLLGIAADEDDDGAAASRPKVSEKKKPSPVVADEDIDFPAPKANDKPTEKLLAEIRKFAGDLVVDKSQDAQTLREQLAKLNWRDDPTEAQMAVAKLRAFFSAAAA